MPMLAESVDAVIGVDTHTDTHTACLVEATGREIATVTVEANFSPSCDGCCAARVGWVGGERSALTARAMPGRRWHKPHGRLRFYTGLDGVAGLVPLSRFGSLADDVN